MNENFVLIIGRLISKPTLTGTNEKQISRLKIRTRNTGNSNVIPVIAFGKNAELLNRLGDRGMDICVRGRIEMRMREIDQNTKVPYISVVADSFNVYGSPSQSHYETEHDKIDDQHGAEDSQDTALES